MEPPAIEFIQKNLRLVECALQTRKYSWVGIGIGRSTLTQTAVINLAIKRMLENKVHLCPQCSLVKMYLIYKATRLKIIKLKESLNQTSKQLKTFGLNFLLIFIIFNRVALYKRYKVHLLDVSYVSTYNFRSDCWVTGI